MSVCGSAGFFLLVK